MHCADVWFKTIPDEGGIGDVLGGNEVYCQTPGGRDSITEEAQMATAIAASDESRMSPGPTDDPNDNDNDTCVYAGHAVDDVVETSDDTTAAGTIATGLFSIQ